MSGRNGESQTSPSRSPESGDRPHRVVEVRLGGVVRRYYVQDYPQGTSVPNTRAGSCATPSAGALPWRQRPLRDLKAITEGPLYLPFLCLAGALALLGGLHLIDWLVRLGMRW